MQADRMVGERFYAVFSERLRTLRSSQDLSWAKISSITGLEIRDLIHMEDAKPFLYSKYRLLMDGLALSFADLVPLGFYPTKPFPDIADPERNSDLLILLRDLKPLLNHLARPNAIVSVFRNAHEITKHSRNRSLSPHPALIDLSRYLNTSCMLRNTELPNLADKLGMNASTLTLMTRGLRNPSMATLAIIGSCLEVPLDCVAPTKASPTAEFAHALIRHHVGVLGDLSSVAATIPEVTRDIESLMTRSGSFYRPSPE